MRISYLLSVPPSYYQQRWQKQTNDNACHTIIQSSKKAVVPRVKPTLSDNEETSPNNPPLLFDSLIYLFVHVFDERNGRYVGNNIFDILKVIWLLLVKVIKVIVSIDITCQGQGGGQERLNRVWVFGESNWRLWRKTTKKLYEFISVFLL